MSDPNEVNPIVQVIQRVQREIQTLRETAHILTPMARTKIDSVAIGKIPVLRVASIDPDPDHGEVYLLKNLGKFALTKVGLMRLEAIAGIGGWTSKVEHMPKVNEKGQTVPDPLHVKATAYAEIEDIDGSVRGKPQTFELDLNDGSPQAEKMVKTKDGTKDYRELAQARVSIVRLAESKSMNAVRRDLLNLQATFTKDELKKPFVIMKLVDAPLNANDPLVRKLLIMKQLKITSEMYDSAAASVALPAEILIPQLPAVQVQALSPAPDEVNDPGSRAIEYHTDLVIQVRDLYTKKVRGGRSASKPPLESLSNDELIKIKETLESKLNIQ